MGKIAKLFSLPFFLFLFLILTSSTALAADWTTFRGNPEHSGVSTETINVPMEEKWSEDIGGSKYSSPIVAGGKVFVGSDDGSVYALPAVAGGPPTWSYPTGGAIESSPLFYSNVVYVGSTDGFLYALNSADLAFLWRFDAGSPISSSPVTDGTNIYFATQSGRVFALNISNGAFVWAYDIADTVFRSSTALVLSKQYNALFIGSENGIVYAINTNGTTKWTYTTTDNGFESSSPAVVGGVVYIGSNNGTVYAITASNGSLSWSYSVGADIDILGSPAVTSNTLYIGSLDGNFYAIGTSGGNKGNLLWSYRVGGADIKSSPVVSGNTVFIGANKLFFALNATTGDFKWSYGVGQDVASPAISNGIIYLASDRLYALESTTTLVAMIEKWKYNTGSTISMSGVAVDAGITYIGADDGKLYAINADGTLRWSYTTNGGMISSTPVVSSGTVYFGARDNKTFYAVNTVDGTLKWTKVLGTGYGYYVVSVPTIVGSVIYFGARDGKLYALNTSNGSEVWTPYQTNGGTPGEYNLSTPIVDGGKIYFTYAYKAMVALDQNTGIKIWETPFVGGGGPPSAANSILLANNTLFAGMDGKIYAINLDGTVKWVTLISGSADRGFVSYGNILVGAGGSGNVYALNLNDGTILWNYTTVGNPGVPFLWQDVVFIMTSGYRVYALNVENGLLRFEYAGNFSPLAPVVTGGILYLGGRDGRIYAEDIDHYSMPMTSALGGTILTVYGDTIQIPPGALASNTTVTITVAPNDQAGGGIIALPRKYQFGPNGLDFVGVASATAKFAYKTSDLQGADPNTVKVYVWDSTTSTWTASGGTADLANKTINVSLDHFSDYALFGGAPQLNFPVLSASYIYGTPVTFKFSAFDADQITNVKGYLNGTEIQSGDQKKLTQLGENTFRVSGQRSDGSEVSQEQRFNVSYSLEWLSPLTNQTGIGDSLPIKFKINDFSGNFVEDTSVKVEVTDGNGNTSGIFSTAKGNVYIKISESHYLINLPVKNFSWMIPGGTYQIKLSFGILNYPPYEFTIQ